MFNMCKIVDWQSIQRPFLGLLGTLPMAVYKHLKMKYSGGVHASGNIHNLTMHFSSVLTHVPEGGASLLSTLPLLYQYFMLMSSKSLPKAVIRFYYAVTKLTDRLWDRVDLYAIKGQIIGCPNNRVNLLLHVERDGNHAACILPYRHTSETLCNTFS